MWDNQIKCHEKAGSMFNYGNDHQWRLYEDETRHCSYCGSIHPEDLYKLLDEGKVRLEGADWKYGWPHKFYVRSVDGYNHIGKFYNIHLLDLTDEELDLLCPLIKASGGIDFAVVVINDERQLRYRAPYKGYQG